MQQITSNVFVETGLGASSLGLVTTMEGIVLIDTPMNPSEAVKWRRDAEKMGKIRYFINTEEHVDHVSGDYFFPGVCISHEETRKNLAKASLAQFIERLKRGDPSGAPLIENYQIRLADITFAKNLDLYLGGLTFKLFHLPGHVPGGVGIYIPEERIVFTGDIIFHKVKTWLQEAVPDEWLDSLKRIEGLDVDFIVPGHGSLCKKDYVKEQAAIVREWSILVRSAFERGLSEEEAQSQISCKDPYPVQRGVPMTDAEVNKRSIANLYALNRARSSRSGD